jgi:hypothetical protein
MRPYYEGVIMKNPIRRIRNHVYYHRAMYAATTTGFAVGYLLYNWHQEEMNAFLAEREEFIKTTLEN